MKYLSEKTNKAYDTEEELKKAEKEFDLKQKQKEDEVSKKKQDAQKVQDAYKKFLETSKRCREEIEKAEQDYYDLMSKFIEKYGSWHMTYTNVNGEEPFNTNDVLTNAIKAFLGW